MDILISSNLERLIYLICGEDSEDKELMEELKTTGKYTITPEMKEKLADFLCRIFYRKRRQKVFMILIRRQDMSWIHIQQLHSCMRTVSC